MRVSVQIRKPLEARADVLVLGRHSDAARPGPELAAVDASWADSSRECSPPRSSRGSRVRSPISSPMASCPPRA